MRNCQVIQCGSIDSGSSHHMMGDAHHLEQKTSMNPIVVSLPNRESVMERCQGNMNLGAKINLEKVLYIPKFSCNLISVSQLIKELKCIKIFDGDVRVIQDHTSKSPIGVSRLRGGVYCFDNFGSSMAQVNMVGSHDLWHESLGHPSNQVLSLISKDLKIHDNVVNKRPCDVCFHSKQT